MDTRPPPTKAKRRTARRRILAEANRDLDGARKYRMRHIQQAVHRVRWLGLVNEKTLIQAGYNKENKQ